MDFATISINATRGQAMHAVVRYALWVRKNTSEAVENGLDDMNEVRSVLDKHLDISKDPSLAIRSVYGRWFPWLQSLDPEWAAENASKYFQKKKSCFPIGKRQGRLNRFCSPYDEILTVLQAQHREAIEDWSELNSRMIRRAGNQPRGPSYGVLLARANRPQSTDKLVAMFFPGRQQRTRIRTRNYRPLAFHSRSLSNRCC